MPSAWIEHVKKYRDEHGVSYKQAMKDSKATYVSVAKPKPPKGERKRAKVEREMMGMEDIRAQQPKPRGRPKKSREVSNARNAELNKISESLRKLEKESKQPKPRMKKYADLAGDAEAEWDENDAMNFLRPKEMTEREKQMAQGDTGAYLFEKSKNKMKAKQAKRDLRKLEKKQKPKKRKVRVIREEEEVEYPNIQHEIEIEHEVAPILPAPFQQPPMLVVPDQKRVGKLLYKNPLLEREIKSNRAKQMKRRSMRQQELDKFKDVIRQLEDPILEKQKRHAIALSEAYQMGEEDKLSKEEREYVRVKKIPVPINPMELINVKEKKRLKRYEKEAKAILEKARKEKELAKIVASYSKPRTKQQIIEDNANDWSSEF